MAFSMLHDTIMEVGLQVWQQMIAQSLPIELLKAQSACIVIVDLVDGILKHLPGLVCKAGFSRLRSCTMTLLEQVRCQDR